MGEDVTDEMVKRAAEAFHRVECRCTLLDEAPAHRGWYRRVAEMSLVAAREVDPLVAEVERLRKALHQTEHVAALTRLAAAEAEVKAARAVMAPTVERWQYLHSRFPEDVAGSWPEMVAYLAARDAHDALSAPPTDRGADGG